jgi:hypothetical protein
MLLRRCHALLHCLVSARPTSRQCGAQGEGIGFGVANHSTRRDGGCGDVYSGGA